MEVYLFKHNLHNKLERKAIVLLEKRVILLCDLEQSAQLSTCLGYFGTRASNGTSVYLSFVSCTSVNGEPKIVN